MPASPRTDIVVTTIFEPDWLQAYLDNLRKFERMDTVTIRIIADRKTPATVFDAAKRARAEGFAIDCPTLDEQASYLQRAGLGGDFVPWDTDNRRNIGFLRAWESGAELLISIDDDNHCHPDTDFVGCHAQVGQTAGASCAYEAGGANWFNICELLELDVQEPVYARGFPYAARTPPQLAKLQAMGTPDQKVTVNAGLWLDDPDVDAIARLALKPHARAAKPEAVVLADRTWSPINTQNTGLLREAIPAYYYVRMGFSVGGLAIDRFGDILSGYFLQKCAKHLGHAIRIGDPVADHKRSPHNLFKDLYHELAGIVVIEDLLPWLQEVPLQGDNYFDTYAALAEALRVQAPAFSGFIWDQGGREFLLDTATAMEQWLRAVHTLKP